MHSQGVTEKRIARRWRDREGKCNRRLTSVANAPLGRDKEGMCNRRLTSSAYALSRRDREENRASVA